MLGIVFLAMHKACYERRILHVPNAFKTLRIIIGSPKRHVECTNNASKCQFALSSPHSFVICRAPQALKHAVLIYIDYI